jgi:hypothetical protein
MPARAVREKVKGLSRYTKSGTSATNARKLRLIGGNDKASKKPDKIG